MLDIDDGPSRRISKPRRRAPSLTTPTCTEDGNKEISGQVQQNIQGDECGQTLKVPAKVSPQKTSDWFCNSFDSRAGRKRKSSHETSPGDKHNKQETTVKRKHVPSHPAVSTDVNQFSKCNKVLTAIDDAEKQHILTEINVNNPNKQSISQNVFKITDIEESFLHQTQEVDRSMKDDGRFAHINDSLALIKVPKASNNSLNETESHYFQTPLTESMPDKFESYKATQKSQEKEVDIENKVTKCQGRVCTPFSFSFIGCDTQCDCDRSLNESNIIENNNQTNLSQVQKGTYIKNDNKETQKVIQENFLSCNSRQNGKKMLLNSQLSSVDVCDDSQVDNNGKVGCSVHVSSKLRNSHLITRNSQLNPELVSGTQYHLGPNTQMCNTQNNSQIQSTSIFNQTGLIVDSQFNQTGLIVDSQDNGEFSDGDIFGDSFNNSAILSQIDELNEKAHSQCNNKESKRNCVEIGPDVTSHTQSLMGSHKQISSGTHRKRQRRKSSFDNDITSIELEMQRRRDGNINSQNTALKDNPEAETLLDTISSSKLSDSVNISVTTELHRSDIHNRAVNNNDTEVSLVQDSAVNIGGTKKTDKSVVEIGNRRLSEPVTPVAGGTLQDRLKKKLQENAGQKTPQGPGSLVQQLREQVLERVQLETAMMRARNQPVEDVGPFYGLPSKVQHLFDTQRGIKTLYEWQDECLKLPAIAERKNLIYSLPTSGGKTLVAEILILQEIICRKKDAVLVLPFVSIVQEKVRNLSQFAVDLDFLVEEYAGSKGRFPPTKRRQKNSLFIATIEKAHSIVNSLIETSRMDSLGLIIVDELHMIGEGGSRGATLESTLMKILHSKESIQIIGMSATLNNIEDLQQFLNAEVYTNDFRPVQLTETIKLSDNIYSVNTKAKCPEDQFLHDRIVCFQYKPEMEKMDPDQLFGLVLEVIPDNSCLVFCPTKKNCENVAMMLSKMMVKYKRELSDVKKKERKDLLKELYNDAAGKICPVLQYTIHFGIAYHHSGLTMDERKLIEEAYIDGTLCLLACTSTLAAGVNLPAKRVILRCPYVGQYFISRSQYKQMVGRAGRAGIDTTGESILICKTSDREKICELLSGPLESCHSSLVYDGGKGLRNLMLSTIGLQIAATTEDIFTFMSRSLAKLQQSYLSVDIIEMCKESLQKLINLGLVLQTKSHSEDTIIHKLEVTQLGKATYKGPIDPDYAGILYKDLKKAEEPLVLSTHLHLLYLVTPYDMVKDIAPSWLIYFTQVNSLSAAEMKVPALIGVPESYLARKASQQKSKLKVDEFSVNRFYLTLMLYDLWKQKTIWEVAEKFQQPRGFIQNLLSSAASFASCVAHFCQEMEEFWAYQDLMGNFVKRLSYCVTAELIPLMEIPGVKLGRAKLMYTAGFRSLSAVASSDPEVLVRSVEHLPRKVARQIVASAKLLLNEKAEAMLEEVEQLVSVPEGIATYSAAMTTTVHTPALVTPNLSQNSVSSQ